MKWIMYEHLAIIIWVSFLDVIRSGQTNGVSIIENHGKTSKIADNLKPCLIPSSQNTVYKILKSGKQDESPSQNPAVTGNGTVVHLECPGKRESTSWFGEHYMVCYDGQWYPPGNKCIKLCPPLADLLNSVIKCTLNDEPVSCEENVRPGTLAEKKCKTSYSDSSTSSNVENVCLETGEWSFEFFDCFISCDGIDKNYHSNSTEFDEVVASPWIAAIYKRVNATENNYEFVCSASVVGTDYIVTAGHCVQINGKAVNKELLRVAVGKKYKKWNDERDVHAQIFKISTVTDMPFHRKQARYFKGALEMLETMSFLIIKGRIDFNSFARPICADTDGFSTKIRHLNGIVTGWDEMGERVSYETIFYNNADCRTMISNLGERDKDLEKEIMRFGSYCTDRVFPESFLGTGAIFYSHDYGAHLSTGVLTCMYKSFSIFVGPRSVEAIKAMMLFYSNLIHLSYEIRMNRA